MKYKVIYVCHSNKGRSPAFEAYTKFFLARRSIKNIDILSTASSLPMVEHLRKRKLDFVSRTTQKILKEQKLSLDRHVSIYIGEVIKGSDLILAVDQHTLDMIFEDFSQYSERMMLVGKYARTKKYREIHGPHDSGRGRIKSELEGYRRMLDEIKYVSRKATKRLIKERREGNLSRRKH